MITLGATSSSGLAVEYALLEGVAELVGDLMTINDPGEIAIAARQSGDASWNAASEIVQRFHVTGRAVVPDSDGDGLPDAFEQAYFDDTTSATPEEDNDHDGLSNRTEWLFGTSPIDAQSSPVLQIGVTDRLISIQSVSERLYTLEVSEDLNEFTAMGDSLPGTGEVIQFPSLPTELSFRAFRVRVSEE